jgi:hypothetical protein
MKKLKKKGVKGHGFAHMKHVFHNGHKNILNNIARCNPFPTMGATKEVGSH